MNERYNLYNLEPSFRSFLAAENISSLTIKNYLSDLRHFLGWITFKLKVQNQKSKVTSDSDIVSFIDLSLIYDYKSYLIENNLPLKTVNRRLSTLRKFCSFCILQGWMKENPAKKISNFNGFDSAHHCPERSRTDKLPTSPDKNQILNEFKSTLIKENFDQQTIISSLDNIREFLAV